MQTAVTTALVWMIMAGPLAAEPPQDGSPDPFTTRVRPILAQHCFKCHGPDDRTRKGKLRLDTRDEAVRPARSGLPAIAPGLPDESELIRRISVDDESEVMPPPQAKLPLSDSEKQTLKDWVADGAEYREHWAFLAPRQSPLPSVRNVDWPINPIDRFVLSRLEAEGLGPSPTADRATLIRRLSLDLTGMAPTLSEVESFVKNQAPDAYDRLVDRLLASPRYGERRRAPGWIWPDTRTQTVMKRTGLARSGHTATG